MKRDKKKCWVSNTYIPPPPQCREIKCWVSNTYIPPPPQCREI